MPKEVITPAGLWNATPRSYSHVVKIKQPQTLVFVAGMAAVDPDLNLLSDTIEGQTRAIFENIGKSLEAAGVTYADVVDMTVYVTDIVNHQWPVREVRAEFFPPGTQPVSTMVEVSRFALDGMLIEIDVIAAT